MTLRLLLIIAALVFLLAVVEVKKSKASENIKASFSPFVKEASDRFHISEQRINAIIYKESSGVPSTVGSANERGLMQLKVGALADYNDFYHEQIAFDSLFDARTNIMVGTGYLSLLQSQYGLDIDSATQAYNAGIGTFLRNRNASLAYLADVKLKELYFT
jgi:soluble lytic murein transglycosylase-like protein